MKFLFSILLINLSILAFAQNLKDSVQATKDSLLTEEKLISNLEKVNAPKKVIQLNPTKAGLYSAILPGLGQYYNKKYWKIPIVWGAVGTGVGIAIWNQNQYKRYRTAFVAELNGIPHEFSDIPGVTAETIGRTQDRAKRQRDYAIAITGLVYILGIVDAVVDAQLYEGRNDPDLAIKPVMIYDQFSQQNQKTGLSLSYRF